MTLLQIIVWGWLGLFLIVATWYYHNTKFVKSYYKKNFTDFNYNTYLNILYITSFILTPILFIVIITEETTLLIFKTYKKFLLELKIRKIKDKNVRKRLRKQLKELKL